MGWAREIGKRLITFLFLFCPLHSYPATDVWGFVKEAMDAECSALDRYRDCTFNWSRIYFAFQVAHFLQSHKHGVD